MKVRMRAFRRRRSAGLVVMMLGLVIAGGAYSAAMPTQADANRAAQSQQVEAGRKLYQVSCSSCHGMNGEGGRTGDKKVDYAGPPLIGVGSAAVDFQVGTGRMPAMQSGAQVPRKKPVFNEEETAALAAYVDSLGPGAKIPDASAYDVSNLSEADITRGGILFRTNCTACHNFAGKGGALPRGRYAPTLMGVESKHIYEAMLIGPQQMPVFSDQVLTPKDKRDVIGYIKAMETHADPGGFGLGRLGPTSEGMHGWIFGIGVLVGFACWIAYRGAKVPKRLADATAAAHDESFDHHGSTSTSTTGDRSTGDRSTTPGTAHSAADHRKDDQ